MTCRVVATPQGAVAMLDLATGEVMHPVGAAGAESRELYVKASRLEARLMEEGSEPLVLLDIGLGAGSNAAAAWKVSEGSPDGARPLSIVSFDKSTDPLDLALGSGNAAAFGLDGSTGEAARTLLTCGSVSHRRSHWRLVLGELPAAFEHEALGVADIVFWDPFSPKSNPSLWTVGTFAMARSLCRPGATLHTYLASTASRAAMLLAGFAVGQGPVTGDRETTVAALSREDLEAPLGQRWLARLSRSSVPLPPDAPVAALELIGALPQFAAVPRIG